MMSVMTDGKESSRREFFRAVGRGLILALIALGTGLLWGKGKIDPSAPRCSADGQCPACPARGECAWLRARRKGSHGGA
jgi:hypothetical protein